MATPRPASQAPTDSATALKPHLSAHAARPRPAGLVCGDAEIRLHAGWARELGALLPDLARRPPGRVRRRRPHRARVGPKLQKGAATPTCSRARARPPWRSARSSPRARAARCVQAQWGCPLWPAQHPTPHALARAAPCVNQQASPCCAVRLIMRVHHGQVVRTYEDTSGLTNTVAFHPDGTCIATGSTDTSLKLWDLRCVPSLAWRCWDLAQPRPKAWGPRHGRGPCSGVPTASWGHGGWAGLGQVGADARVCLQRGARPLPPTSSRAVRVRAFADQMCCCSTTRRTRAQ